MTKVITDNQYYTDIAEAIREKNGTKTLYKPSEMALAILAIKGGAELNFEIVGGTTQPENPKENTIWVNTDQEITGWSFSETIPSNPVVGTVWIETGADGVFAFNALTNDEILIGIKSASTFTEEGWKKNDAFIYDAEWVQFSKRILDLYLNGVEYIADGWAGSTGGGTGTKTARKDATKLYCYAQYSSGAATYASFYTPNKVNVAGFNTLCADVYFSKKTQQSRLVIAEDGINAAKIDGGTYIAETGGIDVTGSRTFKIPLNSVTIKNVHIGVGANAGYGYNVAEMTVSRIWLE